MNFKQTYLTILEVKESRATLEFLKLLISEQLRCFPYENISKIAFIESRGNQMPSAEQYLEDQRKFGYGGTCYPQNIYFAQLLKELPFDCNLIQASVNDKPGAHILIKVIIDNISYFVDFGFMDTFCAPFHVDKEAEQVFIGRKFKYIPGSQHSKFSFKIWKDDNLLLKFIEEAEVKDLKDFEVHIKNSFSKDQYFMNNIVLGRRWGKPCYNIVNDKASFYDGKNVKQINFDSIEKME